MHRKIYTKRESFGGIAYSLLFTAIWYSVLLKQCISQGRVSPELILFLLAGLLPLVQTAGRIRQALYYRRLHREAMERPPRRGKIINCQRATYRERVNSRRTRLAEEYRLTVAVGLEEIQSEPYSWPVYQALASPEVDVYTDESGWHHVIDGFQYKSSRNDPDIFQEDPFTKPSGRLQQMILQGILLTVMAAILLYILLF